MGRALPHTGINSEVRANLDLWKSGLKGGRPQKEDAE